MPVTFRQIFILVCIVSFPLFILFVVTQGFIDTLPLFENPDTGLTLMFSGFLYLIVSLFLRRRSHYVFFTFFITAISCLLAGVTAYCYFWHFVPYPLEPGSGASFIPPGWGIGL